MAKTNNPDPGNAPPEEWTEDNIPQEEQDEVKECLEAEAEEDADD